MRSVKCKVCVPTTQAPREALFYWLRLWFPLGEKVWWARLSTGGREWVGLMGTHLSIYFLSLVWAVRLGSSWARRERLSFSEINYFFLFLCFHNFIIARFRGWLDYSVPWRLASGSGGWLPFWPFIASSGFQTSKYSLKQTNATKLFCLWECRCILGLAKKNYNKKN